VLEIGAGWGSLAIRAAQRGAVVTSVTLSREQLTLAEERVADAAPSARVDLRLQANVKSRKSTTPSSASRCSKPSESCTGRRTSQRSTGCWRPGQGLDPGHHDVARAHASDPTIVQLDPEVHLPGGIIPSLQAIEESLAGHTTLRVSSRRQLGPHYAQTLKQWRSRFLEDWPQVQMLGFDETFRRMWEFYLAYCQAGFRSGYLGVSRLQLTRRPTWP
jgi:cyclopropane-fatty-acyl-phospholipid synthase